MRVAARIERMGTEAAFRVFTRARELEAAGMDVIHLEMGQPDFPTPAHVVEAGIQALREGRTGYTPAAGLPELREAIARDASRRRGVSFEPEQVVVCPGGKPVIFFAFLALVEAGDEVVLPDPGFPIFASMADAVGATKRTYPAGTGARGRPGLDRLAAAVNEKTSLVVLNSPGNPTGVVHRPDEIRRIAEVCRRGDAWVLSDEIYSRILFDGSHASVVAEEGMAERTIVLDGFSKTWSMTGWRLGYAILPPPLVPCFERLMTNSVSCAVHFVQRAAIAALEGPDDSVVAMVNALRRRRDVLVQGLADVPGVTLDAPEGTFFALADVSGTGREASALARDLLERAGVALVEGASFGPSARQSIRFSLTAPEVRIAEAVDRLRNLLRS